MFPWPDRDETPDDWTILWSILKWYARIVGAVVRWFPGAVTRWFAGVVAGFIRGMHPSRAGSLMKWVLVGVFAAMLVVVWDALTFQWLLSLSRR
jgi:hypothetical protein